jgi:glucan 1,3-beta-glucosidase
VHEFMMALPFFLALLALLLLLLGLFSTATAGPAGNHQNSTSLPVATLSPDAYWLADIKHQGLAPFAAQDYQVFRNVKDFGAKGASALLPRYVGVASRLTFC